MRPGNTPKKPKVRKPPRRCPECGTNFRTRSRIARHRLAHAAVEAAMEEGEPLTVEQAEAQLAEMVQSGELVRDHFGYRLT